MCGSKKDFLSFSLVLFSALFWDIFSFFPEQYAIEAYPTTLDFEHAAGAVSYDVRASCSIGESFILFARYITALIASLPHASISSSVFPDNIVSIVLSSTFLALSWL